METGQPVTLSWHVEYADRVVLRTQAGLVIESYDKPDPEGAYQVTPDVDTIYILEAYNFYTGSAPETDASIVKVVIPPPPTPDIAFFMAQPAAVIEGTPVVLSWRVTGADTVSLESDDPVDRPIEVGPDGPSISRAVDAQYPVHIEGDQRRVHRGSPAGGRRYAGAHTHRNTVTAGDHLFHRRSGRDRPQR